MDIQGMITYIMDILGTIAFAASGAMVVIRKRMDIFGVCFIGEWLEGTSFPLADTAGFIDSYDAVLTDDGFVISFLETHAQIEGEQVITSADFKYAQVPIAAKLELSGVEYDITSIKPGAAFEAEVTVRNTGVVTANGVAIALYSPDGTLVSASDSVHALLPGEELTFTVTLTAPQKLTMQECTMVATVGGSAVSNSIGVPVGYADLGIVAQQKIIGGKNYILYTVTNTGNLSAEASLVIRKYAQNGQTLASAEGLAVPAGETTVYTFDASAVAENELVYAAVTTAEYEPFVLNNEALINLLHIDTDVYLYTPQDTVENPQLSVTTVTYDKYTDDAVSVNILVGKDKLSAITRLPKGVDYTVNNGAVALS